MRRSSQRRSPTGGRRSRGSCRTCRSCRTRLPARTRSSRSWCRQPRPSSRRSAGARPSSAPPSTSCPVRWAQRALDAVDPGRARSRVARAHRDRLLEPRSGRVRHARARGAQGRSDLPEGGGPAMIKQAPTPRNLVAMAVFALSCFGLLLFLWTSFGGSIPLKPQGYRYYADFGEATQLTANADVRISGVSVGRVASVVPNGTTTRATLEIDHQYAPIA